MEANMETTLLRTEEAAKMMGILTGTLRKWRYQNKGPAFVLIGTAVRYRPEAIAEYMKDVRPEK